MAAEPAETLGREEHRLARLSGRRPGCHGRLLPARRRLLGRVLQAAEDERTRIAHDLHDGPVQQLAVLNDDIYRARKRISDLLGQVGGDALRQDLQGADEVLEGVEKGLGEETRALGHMMSALRPPVLDNLGFAEALTEHAHTSTRGRSRWRRWPQPSSAWRSTAGGATTCAPYPVVPRREAGFRVQLTAANTAEQVDHRFGFPRPHP